MGVMEVPKKGSDDTSEKAFLASEGKRRLSQEALKRVTVSPTDDVNY